MFPPIATLPGTLFPGSPEAPVVVMPPLSGSAASVAPPRFDVLRTRATGGLGRVSVALDNEPHRQVALKEIRSSLAVQ